MRRLSVTFFFLLSAFFAGAQDHLTIKTVVIDAGHGGRDAGCISRDRKTYEKTLTLDIAKRLQEKIHKQLPDVKVIMTRSADEYVELNERAAIANRNAADLFISIHINSVERGTSANGCSIHCLGQSSRAGNDLFDKNLELCRRENSVILLEDDYSTKYQGFDPNDPQSYILFSLMQNAHLEQSLQFAEDVNAAMEGGPIARSRGVSQDPFLVLWQTTMPAVLIECGFITNPDDLAKMRSPGGRDGIAGNLLQALTVFKTRYDGAASTRLPGQVRQEEEEEQPAVVRFGTQVLATKKPIPDNDAFFKGYKPESVTEGSLTKYIIGVSADKEEALRKNLEIRKKFRDSFFVRLEGNQAKRVK